MQFFQSSRPGCLHLVCCKLGKVVSELQSVIACSVTLTYHWHMPNQTGKTGHVHTKQNKHRGCVPDKVFYLFTMVSLSKHNWTK